MIITFRFSIIFLFTLLFFISFLIIFGISKARFQDMLLYTSYQFMERHSTAALSELVGAMQPAEVESRFTADLIKNGVLNPDNEERMIGYTYFLVKMLPLIQVARWGDEQGNFIVSEQEKDGSVSSEVYNRRSIPATRLILKRNSQGHIISRSYTNDVSYDPRTRSWYTDAKAGKKTIWSNVYQYHRRSTLAITAASPVYYPTGELRGVFGLDIQIEYLVKFLEHRIITPNGFSYIVSEEGALIAMPAQAINGKPNALLTMQDISTVKIPWLAKSIQKFQHTKKKKFSLKYDNDTLLFVYKEIPLFEKFHWLMGVVVPEKDFTVQLEKMHQLTYLLCLLTLIIGLFILSHLVTRVVTPLQYLAKETEKIKRFELDTPIYTRSRIKEIIDLTNAIKAMLRGLRSFQKYVPKTLVQQLIEAQEDSRVGGVRKSLVILFSDIKNFTAIAETIDPNLLMLQMCEYFDELTQIILDVDGTIDKYIGDSIMAFWGAPFPEKKPCQKAAIAALFCQKKLIELNQRWLKEGKPPLITRVGIHMGDAIIGNVGSSERLNYTAIGDTINMASRFENINKLYGTQIIVSDTVYHEIKNEFILRPLDYVAVKGRRESNYVYELLAESKDEIPYDIDAYRAAFIKGFDEYRHQKFDAAIQWFEECLKIYPADTVSTIFIVRCEHFKLTPPPAEWYGIWRIDEQK